MLQQIALSKLDYINQKSPLFTDLWTNGKQLLKIYLLRYRSFHVGCTPRLKEQDNFQICLEIYMGFCVIIQICVGVWGKIK